MKLHIALLLALASLSVVLARDCDSEKALKSGPSGCEPDYSSPKICRILPETGPCMARFVMWGFNRLHGQCEQFTYGGCQGNGNRFATMKECEDKCLM
ncbi:kunitz-type serine protease inhibitor conotoxin Cal9.1d-like [Lineus longissimus]|uniref:kunitz-type serine protease inhibitor conotoxin Cal9.1d-like n=1 Tax=Lineus longissimus TaxID=88925 RepID=UPI002B4E4488